MSNENNNLENDDTKAISIEEPTEPPILDSNTNEDELISKIEQSIHEIIKDKKPLPQEIFLLPVKDRPFFPGQTLPVILSKELWEETILKAIESQQKYIGIIFVNADDHHNASPSDFSKTGTLVKIHDPKFANWNSREANKFMLQLTIVLYFTGVVATIYLML